MKKLSIITINYNNKSGLQATINSVLQQTFRAFEFIIIDGGSADGSVELIEQYTGELSVWVSEKDDGIFNAQNKGAARALGEYLLFLNSGDILADNAVLEFFVPKMLKQDLIYGDIVLEKKEGRENLPMPDKLDVYYFMISSLAHPAVFIRRSFFERLKGYNETLELTADYEFFLRAVLVADATYKHYSRDVAVFNTDGLSSDPKNHDRQIAERRKSWELNFSIPVVEALEEYTRLLRSSELKTGKIVHKLLSPFKRNEPS